MIENLGQRAARVALTRTPVIVASKPMRARSEGAVLGRSPAAAASEPHAVDAATRTIN